MSAISEIDQVGASGDIIDRLRSHAAATPDRVLYTELLDGTNESAQLTARELCDRAAALAGSLERQGVNKGDVVLMIATAPCEFLVALFGCMWAGVIAAPIAFPRRVEHLTTRLEPVRKNAGAVAVVAGPAQEGAEQTVLEVLTEGTLPVIATAADPAGAMAEPVTEREIAYLQYTSGSTSDPRGVIVTHANLMANLAAARHLLKLDENSVNVSWCPLTHDMGLIMGALTSIDFGHHSVLMPPSAFVRRPLTWLRAFDKYRGTHGYSPNFGYDLCVDRSTEEQRAELDLSSVQVLVNGAEPVRRHTRDRFNAAFAVAGLAPTTHSPSYGLAESTVIVSATPVDSPGQIVKVDAAALEQHQVVMREAEDENTRELCCDGVIAPSYDARIVDPVTFEEIPVGQVGELWLAGPCVSPGYWMREEATKAAFGAMTSAGDGPFLRTGDLAFFANGEVVICGRANDMIVIHGRNLYPQDIELAVEFAHPAVHAGGSAAFAVDDGETEALVVVVEVNGEPDESAVAAAIGTAVMREFELHVKDVLLVAPFTVPKTSSGKKQRSLTRRLWSEARGEAPAGLSA